MLIPLFKLLYIGNLDRMPRYEFQCPPMTHTKAMSSSGEVDMEVCPRPRPIIYGGGQIFFRLFFFFFFPYFTHDHSSRGSLGVGSRCDRRSSGYAVIGATKDVFGATHSASGSATHCDPSVEERLPPIPATGPKLSMGLPQLASATVVTTPMINNMASDL